MICHKTQPTKPILRFYYTPIYLVEYSHLGCRNHSLNWDGLPWWEDLMQVRPEIFDDLGWWLGSIADELSQFLFSIDLFFWDINIMSYLVHVGFIIHQCTLIDIMSYLVHVVSIIHQCTLINIMSYLVHVGFIIHQCTLINIMSYLVHVDFIIHQCVTLWVGYMHIYVYTRVCVHPYQCACVCMYVCICVCAPTPTRTCAHAHIYTHIYVARWVRFGLGIEFQMLGKPIN